MQRRETNFRNESERQARVNVIVAITFATVMAACGGFAGAGTKTTDITVAITPASASVLLGNGVAFAATVSGSDNAAVNWTVNAVAGGNAQVGTISPAGEYTAPQTLPSPSSVTVAAIAQADTTSTASASVTITSDVAVTISPTSATVDLGTTQAFTATIASAGKPTDSVTWSVDGIAGGNASLGTITSTGADSATFTAPATLPSSPSVTVTATSVADGTKSASASVTLECATTNSITPATASVSLGQTQSFAAALCAAPGATIVWSVNGTAGGSSTLGTIAITGASSATYAAPADLPTLNPVTVQATAGTVTASATVTIVSNVTVSVTPPSASVPVSGRATFSALVSNTPDATVLWTVNGIANGNATLGQVCLTGTNPCQPPSGPTATSVDFLAPSTVPASNPVVLTATSNADSSKSSSAQITITSSGIVTIALSPAYAFVPPSGDSPSQAQFTAQVTGGSADVTWSVESGVAGSGCGGTACGTVSSTGLYTAPSIAPSPNAISVIATSAADPTQSSTASVAITSGSTIEQILPSSVMAGAASSFTLAVNGAGFVAGSGSSASVILVNGNARATTCASELQCTALLQPSDVSTEGTTTIQIQNPGQPAALSNPVPFVVVPFTLTQNVIALSAAQPEVTGNTIVVFEPTTEGTTSAQINVDFAGPVTSGGACNFDSSPVEIAPPSSGTATLSICVQGNLLDPSFTYQFTAPPTPDILISTSSLASVFPNLIQLNLTISSATLPGVRSLFISTPNNDQAVATGLVEVQ